MNGRSNEVGRRLSQARADTAAAELNHLVRVFQTSKKYPTGSRARSRLGSHSMLSSKNTEQFKKTRNRIAGSSTWRGTTS